MPLSYSFRLQSLDLWLGTTTVTTGASGATQTVGSTAGYVAGDYLYFGTTAAARIILSVTNATTVVLTQTISTTTSEVVTLLKPAVQVYAAALTTLPTVPDGTGLVEVTNANAYARIALVWSAPANPGTILINGNQSFANPSGSWGTVKGLAYYTSGTYGAGTLWGYSYLVQRINGGASLEALTLAAGIGQLANKGHVEQLIVKNSAENTDYTEGTDYSVDYNQGTITRISTGAIGVTDTLRIDYYYPWTAAVGVNAPLQLQSAQVGIVYKGFN